MRTPTQAAHVLGKLLKHVGEDNVVWGTDCLFYGSPQPQIQAFRAFHISDEFQERYGYPKLTKELRAKVLGWTPRACTGSSRCRRAATLRVRSSRRSVKNCETETGYSVRRRWPPRPTFANTTAWRWRPSPRGRSP